MSHLKNILISLVFLPLLTSCGGGGGGGGSSSSGPAEVAISAEPTRIDSGDETVIQIEVFDVQDNVALKIRHTLNAFSFIPFGSYIEVDGKKTSINPTVHLAGEDATFFVFYLSKSLFGKGDSGTLVLPLVGKQGADPALIEVDADRDDPFTSNAVEFNISAPQFSALDETEIRVDEEVDDEG